MSSDMYAEVYSVNAITALIASMFSWYSHCFTLSGYSSGAPKYQNSMCASSGTLRIDST